MRSSVRVRTAVDIPKPKFTHTRQNGLYNYLHRERMVFYTNSDGSFYDKHGVPRPSHNDLFGGMLLVPDDDNEIQSAFAMELAKAVERKEILGLCENRTRFTRFYLDLDYEGPTTVLPDDVVRLVRNFLPVMELAFPSVPSHARATVFRSIICMSPPKRVGEQDQGVKTGVHVIFPEIILGYENLVRLNIACRETIESLMGQRLPPENPWSDVFDVSMYRTGLRMVFMDKNAPCPACKLCPSAKERPQPLRDLHERYAKTGKTTTKGSRVHIQTRFDDITSTSHRSSTCGHPRCRNGYIEQNRPYKIRRCLDGFGHEDTLRFSRLRANTYLCILECSIRAPRVRQEQPAFHEFVGCPQVPPDMLLAAFATRARDTRSIHVARVCAGGDPQMASAIQKESHHRTKIFIQPNDPRIHILRMVVRSYDVRFQGLEIRNVFLTEDQGLYFVNVMGPGDMACANRLHRHHRRSRVYFMVTPHYVVQKCTNRNPKAVNRAHGSCMRYTGPKVSLDPSYREALFSKLEYKPVLALGIASSAVVPIVSSTSAPNPSSISVSSSDSLHTLAPASDALVSRILCRPHSFAKSTDVQDTHAPSVERPVVDVVRKRKRVDLHQLKL